MGNKNVFNDAMFPIRLENVIWMRLCVCRYCYVGRYDDDDDHDDPNYDNDDNDDVHDVADDVYDDDVGDELTIIMGDGHDHDDDRSDDDYDE